MHPKIFLTASCACLLVLVSGAPGARGQSAASVAPAQASGAADAVPPIKSLYARLAQVEHAGGSFGQRAQMLAPVIDQVFNLPVVLQNSVGLRYRSLPEAQKQQLLDQFRQFTIARYVSNFAANSGESFKVDPGVTASPVGGDQVVHSQIIGSGGDTTDINYVMRQSSAGWQVVDVLLNGNISQVAVQRADFGSSVSNGDAAALIDSLKKKTQAFSES